MSLIRLTTSAEQVAEYLRAELQRGAWHDFMPAVLCFEQRKQGTTGKPSAITNNTPPPGPPGMQGNSAHPSLRFKKLVGHDRIICVRINDSFRALAERKGGTATWFWIGFDFDKLFG
jgi:hypothetical protein